MPESLPRAEFTHWLMADIPPTVSEIRAGACSDGITAKVQSEMKDDEILKTIKEGKKDREKVLMKAYKDTLSEQEINDLLAHIRSLKK